MGHYYLRLGGDHQPAAQKYFKGTVNQGKRNSI